MSFVEQIVILIIKLREVFGNKGLGNTFRKYMILPMQKCSSQQFCTQNKCSRLIYLSYFLNFVFKHFMELNIQVLSMSNISYHLESFLYLSSQNTVD